MHVIFKERESTYIRAPTTKGKPTALDSGIPQRNQRHSAIITWLSQNYLPEAKITSSRGPPPAHNNGGKITHLRGYFFRPSLPSNVCKNISTTAIRNWTLKSISCKGSQVEIIQQTETNEHKRRNTLTIERFPELSNITLCSPTQFKSHMQLSSCIQTW